MGTRADFYVGRGKDAEWLGSIGWDGYPSGIPDSVRQAETEQSYREAVEAFLTPRRDTTRPADGWPWPWNDSNTTDFAYAFSDGAVHSSCFGGNWFLAADPDSDESGDGPKLSDVPAEFPDMRASKNVALDERSGVIFVTAARP